MSVCVHTVVEKQQKSGMAEGKENRNKGGKEKRNNSKGVIFGSIKWQRNYTLDVNQPESRCVMMLRYSFSSLVLNDSLVNQTSRL